MTGLRLNCIVPGCRHTRGQRKGEPPLTENQWWVCGTHWPLVPKYLRRRMSWLRNRYRRRFGNTPFWEFKAGSEQRLEAVRLDRLWSKAEEKCKRAAIERGVGI